MDRLQSMSLFVQVVEGGSLSAASRKLNIPLASVSRKLGELEAYLQVRLLTRTTRRLELTDSGRTYFSSCKQILTEIDEADRIAAGEYVSPKGGLTITAPVMFGQLYLLGIITDFLRAYPEVNVRFVQTDQSVDLLNERIDIALRIGQLADSSMVAKKIGVIHEVICASPEYLKKRGAPKKPEDLASHDCVTFDRLGRAAVWIFGKGYLKKQVSIHSRLTVSSAEAAVEAAMAGLGITRVLSYQVQKYLKNGKLVSLLEKDLKEEWPVNLLYASGKNLPLKMRAYLDFAVPRLKNKLSQF